MRSNTINGKRLIAKINAPQIKEHMEVKGSDGKHVGTVLDMRLAESRPVLPILARFHDTHSDDDAG